MKYIYSLDAVKDGITYKFVATKGIYAEVMANLTEEYIEDVEVKKYRIALVENADDLIEIIKKSNIVDESYEFPDLVKKILDEPEADN